MVSWATLDIYAFNVGILRVFQNPVGLSLISSVRGSIGTRPEQAKLRGSHKGRLPSQHSSITLEKGLLLETGDEILGIFLLLTSVLLDAKAS
ncbi:hypothetical protein HYC85_028800 [Camellia sinensis]|uniref:Uncharacterized protein n=1 Tax=Camellia sinensis TaxID=4442 RepID=A0A7J7FWE6_CAMSI|nr:hypothetical protein HYC85_028800 [Camellia sinensis]